MSTLELTQGLPGSGKTTYAEKQLAAAEPGRLARVNRDRLREMLHGQPHHKPVTEEQVTVAQHTTVEKLLRAGVNVIVDDTNLVSRHVRTFAQLAQRAGAEFRVRSFTDVPLEECIRRDAARESPVGEDVIRNMHRRFLAGRKLPLPVPTLDAPVTGRPYVPNPTLPRTVMVDIDGTVALHQGVRGPFDTSRYHLDAPNRAVIEVVHGLYLAGYQVVFCSGREETYREVTEVWLKEHVGIPYVALHMRKAGDMRRDDLVKLELFDEHIRGHYQVVAVFDDRDRVVQAWRSVGLTVLQVADGAF